MVVVFSIFVIVLIGKYAISYAKKGINQIGKTTAKLVGKTMGEPMQKDLMGHINVLIVWYAWEHERGSFLTDTIMLASFDPTLWAVTFLSIPRDTYVIYDNWRKGKINGVYRSKYLETDGDEDKAAMALARKVEEITDVPISYYMMINFDGFTEFIDTLGWIDVQVKQTIHDPYFPWPHNSYKTFHIDAWPQHLDGATALKYARSRKTTSDFSRALRQQQVIEWVIKKLVSANALSKAKSLYNKFKDVIQTNISFKNMLWLSSYIERLKYFFSYVYTADCDLRYLDLTDPGCVMRFGDPQEFWWASVIIPEGASYGKLDYYKKTQDFAFRVVYNQKMLMENAPISLYNGIDKKAAKKQGYNVNGVAGALSLDLKKRGFNIVDLDNTKEFFDETILYIPGDGRYPETVDALKAFVDVDRVTVDATGEYGSGGISLILGYDYVKRL